MAADADFWSNASLVDLLGHLMRPAGGLDAGRLRTRALIQPGCADVPRHDAEPHAPITESDQPFRDSGQQSGADSLASELARHMDRLEPGFGLARGKRQREASNCGRAGCHEKESVWLCRVVAQVLEPLRLIHERAKNVWIDELRV